MPTNKGAAATALAPRDWGTELSKKGWTLRGIDLNDEAVKKTLFNTLGIEKDYIRQSQLVGYIMKRQSPRYEIQRMVKTATRNKLIANNNYIFDGLVPMAYGQGNTVLQYVVRGSELYCAKIGDAATIEAEIQASKLIHDNQLCPSVIPVIDSIKIDKDRVAMITPFYPMPVSQTTTTACTEPTIVNVALCGLPTIKAFSNKRLCHGDIKPSNMMFQASSRTVVTIDYGSCKEYNHTLDSTTPLFSLDCGNVASLGYDLRCLAASIMLLSGIELDTIQTRKEALSELALHSGIHITLASLCLDNTVPNNDLDDMRDKVQALVHDALPYADLIVNLNEIWPRSGKCNDTLV